MIKSEYRIGRVWGIPIKIHISLLILLLFFIFRAIGDSHNMVKALVNVTLVITGATLLFSSIALHELGHSFVAIRKGCRVYEITLMFMGGAAKMDRMPSRPMDELLMALAGPAVSLILGAVCMTASIIPLRSPPPTALNMLGYILFFTGFANLFLTAFNLIPAFPMDGGRVFRAILTKRLGRLNATFVASRLGKFIAVIFFFVGIFGLNIHVFGAQFFPPRNFLLIIIAFFVYSTADREFRMVQFEELAKQRGRDIFTPFAGYASGSTTDDSSVIISPPPYEDGPASRAKLKVDENEDRNPFGNFFKFRR